MATTAATVTCRCTFSVASSCWGHACGSADRHAAAGTVEELALIVGRIRQRWPGEEIWLHGDSGFCREELMAWCEAQGVEYVLGIA